MIQFLLSIGLAVIILLLPVLYAAVLTILIAFWGDTALVHLSLCALFFLICLPGILFLIKKIQRQNREGDSDGKES